MRFSQVVRRDRGASQALGVGARRPTRPMLPGRTPHSKPGPAGAGEAASPGVSWLVDSTSMTRRGLLFVTGMGRSGTTALLEVLASHSGIALGVERFKRLWNPASAIEGLTADRFERDRFFDFSEQLTNLTPEAFQGRWADHYRRMALKWDHATYVGDKMTALRMKPVWQVHPDARFVCIVRDPAAVAHSWNERALNPDDRTWSAAKDARIAVNRWNAAVGKILRARLERPDRLVVVEHDRFFADPGAASLRAVLDFLGLGWEQPVAEGFAAAHTYYLAHVSHKQRELPDDEARFVRARADRELWREVTALAV
jgi:hypothetical protein